MYNELKSNDGINGWDALMVAGAAVGLIAGYGATRRMMGKSSEAIGKAGAGGIGKFLGADYGTAAKRMMTGEASHVGAAGGKGSAGGFGKVLKNWATAADYTAGNRLAPALGRIGAMGAAAYGLSYVNPFTRDQGTVGGTLKTAALGLGIAAGVAYGGGGRGMKNWWKGVGGIEGAAAAAGGQANKIRTAAGNMADIAMGKSAGGGARTAADAAAMAGANIPETLGGAVGAWNTGRGRGAVVPSMYQPRGGVVNAGAAGVGGGTIVRPSTYGGARPGTTSYGGRVEPPPPPSSVFQSSEKYPTVMGRFNKRGR